MEGRKLRAILLIGLVMAMLVEESSASFFKQLECYLGCAVHFQDTTQLMECIALCTNPLPPLPPSSSNSANSCTKDCSRSCYQNLGSKSTPDSTTMKNCVNSCADSCRD
ncbi:hypothetical protein Dimus_027777 [Dionaea muscipula]